MKVGVLALQGDVPEHRAAFEALVPRSSVVSVRTPKSLEAVAALSIPGGESTTISDLLVASGLWAPLRQRLADGLPVLATCAGLIVLARVIEPSGSGRDPTSFGVLDITVRRNDYGRQRESFEAPVRVSGLRGAPFPGVFIRSPRILKVGKKAKPIAFRENEVVGVRAGAIVGLSFHPELADDPRVHAWFLKDVVGYRAR